MYSTVYVPNMSFIIEENTHYDLVTPDGTIESIAKIDETTFDVIVFIEKISSIFVGFVIDPQAVFFNLKSALAQLELNSTLKELELNPKNFTAKVRIHLQAIGPVGKEMIKIISVGSYIGKLFAADERRRVRDPEYLARLFGRGDRWGKPLLSLGGLYGSKDLILDKIDGRTVAFLTLQNGKIIYESSIYSFLPTIAKALTSKIPLRNLVKLHQEWKPYLPRNVVESEMLLVRTLPLHIRTVFAKVVDELLSPGYYHTSASVLQPDTQASGDIYELFGSSKREITDIPLEFYTLDPYREHVFFSDRDQLQTSLEDPEVLFQVFKNSPEPKKNRAAVFIVKGEQLLNLKEENWIVKETHFHEFPGPAHGTRQGLQVERYIEQQPCYPFLKAIDDNIITSQGVLLTRYFPSSLMKRMLLSNQVQRLLKGIYFHYPSQHFGDFFSSEDRTLMQDLYKFGTPLYWVDETTHTVLQYVQKAERDTGIFVPIQSVGMYLKATVFGIYGSNILSGLEFGEELKSLLHGIQEMRDFVSHPLLHKDTPLALVTGGGPGIMEIGNKTAKELNILSCANVLDFRITENSVVNEQRQNPYIEAKMTYRIDKLIERQAEFNLHFPIFLTGGVGTDFEFSLEEVWRKVGMTLVTPVILFGDPQYWREKITSRFRCNLAQGTIKGSEWLSNCFYCIQTAKQGLDVYYKFFTHSLPIGKDGPVYPDGFTIWV